MLKNKLEKHISRITGYKTIKLDQPSQEDHGDYATNLALVEAKRQKKNPHKLAEEIKSQLEADSKLMKLVESIEVAGPGFINFWIKEEVLVESIRHPGPRSGVHAERVMLEFAHPNTHKAFHIGHLRNITTGESLVRLLGFAGYKVVRANYQGDVGMHIAKAMFGVQEIGLPEMETVQEKAQFLSRGYVHGNLAYEEDEKKRAQIVNINKSLYKKDNSELNSLYLQTRKWSLDYFETIYKRVYTKFDRYYFESEVADSALAVIETAKQEGILEESEGAVCYKGEKDGLHTRVFVSSEGNPTYEGKDLALAKLQFDEYDPAKIIHIVGPEQTEYFKVVFKVIEQVFPEYKDREIHIPYGWVSLKSGKMASRKGNVILGEWLLDEAKAKILEKYDTDEETAEKIAVAAVKYSFLKVGLNQEISFDIEESVSLEGNSGPYIQYTYARTQSVLEKYVASHPDAKGGYSFISGSILKQVQYDVPQEEREVLLSLSRFEEAALEAAQSHAPNLLCNYLYDLSQKFNSFYNKHKIIGSEEEVSRLFLTHHTGERIKKGLELLGIKAPEKM